MFTFIFVAARRGIFRALPGAHPVVARVVLDLGETQHFQDRRDIVEPVRFQPVRPVSTHRVSLPRPDPGWRPGHRRDSATARLSTGAVMVVAGEHCRWREGCGSRSRATNTAVEGSDWDFGLYSRDRLDPADVVALGWPGRVFAPGEWGSIVNGGAWVLSYPMSGLVLA